MEKTKSLLALLLHIVVNLPVQAQLSQLEYRPFAQDNKTWEIQVGGIMENVYGNYIDGDTVINGEKWKKVYNYVGFPEFNHSYYCAIRDVGKKVYAIGKASNHPRLLYDFNIETDDLVKCGVEGNAFGCLLDKDEEPDSLLGFPFKAYLKVERIDTIKVRGMEHRRFILTLLDAFKEYFRNGEDVITENVVWVEGVGSGAGPFSPWMPLPPENTLLQKCMIGKTYIFGYSDFYEYEETDNLYCPDASAEKSTRIYDLSGRLANQFQKCIYIKNGKKVLQSK